MVNIFVGNLSPHTREEQLLELFAAHGAVASVTIVTDRDTGQSRGIAFVEMLHSAEALSAVSSVNGTLVNGHTLRVNEGRLKPAKNPNQLSSQARDHRRHRI
jgi:RNA recognition motif-containing protein